MEEYLYQERNEDGCFFQHAGPADDIIETSGPMGGHTHGDKSAYRAPPDAGGATGKQK